MANVTEQSNWEVGVYQIETSDAVIGGVGGIANRQALQLANRTLWLKNQVAGLGTGKQDADSTLAALANLTTSANQMIYATGADAFATTPLTAFARTLLDDTTAAAALLTLGAAALASPTFTGIPAAPTAAVGNRSTQIATTTFVGNELASLFAGSLTQNGWQKLSNGLIIQWGIVAISDAEQTAAYETSGTVGVFPIPFPNSCIRAVCSDVGAACGAASITPVSNSSFKIWARSTSGVASGAYNFMNYSIQYIALGF